MDTRWSEELLSTRLAQLCSHLVVALVALVGIGGATRVMEAGLACPDWPLCYGSLLPGGRMNMQVFLEWFHRLDAFVVGVALLVLCSVSIWQRRQLPRWLPWLSGAALLLVMVQGGLGALTVLALLVSLHIGRGLNPPQCAIGAINPKLRSLVGRTLKGRLQQGFHRINILRVDEVSPGLPVGNPIRLRQAIDTAEGGIPK